MRSLLFLTAALAVIFSGTNAANISCAPVHTGGLYFYNIQGNTSTPSSISTSHLSPGGLPELVTPSPSGAKPYTFYACMSTFMGFPQKQTQSNGVINYYGVIGKDDSTGPSASGSPASVLVRDANPDQASVANLVRAPFNTTDGGVQRRQYWNLVYKSNPSGKFHRFDLYPILQKSTKSQGFSDYTIDAQGNTRLSFVPTNATSTYIAYLADDGNTKPNF
ncbi:hypothetical protein OC861_003581 [Tilletia horrida]|nr:hypothetical protein OC845_004388 [Tilletia horrida]KAK0565760.1 hypothetical protein OC861_003581 [Tilletia horrida]